MTMKVPLERLLADVMARLGETAPLSGELSASGVPTPGDVVALKVKSLLPEAGTRLIRAAPAEALGIGVSGLCGEMTMRIMPCSLYAAEVHIPEGFVRLGAAKMADWRGSVRSVIHPDMADWPRQWSEHMGIAGCPEWPRAYLDSDGHGRLLRLMGSMEPTATAVVLGIWCVPSLDEEGKFDFPEALYPDLVSAIALSLQS